MSAKSYCPFTLRALKERDSVSITRTDTRTICKLAGEDAIWGYRVWSERIPVEGRRILGSVILYPNIDHPVVTTFVQWPEGLTKEDVIQAILDHPTANEIDSVPSRSGLKPIHLEDSCGKMTALFPEGEKLVFGLNQNAMIVHADESVFGLSRQRMLEWLRRTHPYAIVVCGAQDPNDWSSMKDLGYVRRCEEAKFEGRHTPIFPPVNEESLSLLLQKAGNCSLIGPEKRTMCTEQIEHLESPEGSHRFIFVENGQTLSAIQIMSKDGEKGVLTNAFTVPGARRRGLALQLVKMAKSHFLDLEYSQERSAQGAAWVEHLESEDLSDDEVGVPRAYVSRPRL